MEHTGTVLIETDRLLLRKFELSDTKNMYRNWASDSRVTKFLRWQPHESIHMTERVIKSWLNTYSDERFYNWAIMRKSDRELMGSIGVSNSGEHDKWCEVGYSSGYNYWGNGYMTEALKAVVDHMLYDVKYNRVEAHHAVNNFISGIVMEKAGMIQEGILRERYICNLGFQDMCIKGITKYDYIQQHLPLYKEFFDLTQFNLRGNGIQLECYDMYAAVPSKDRVPVYIFNIVEIKNNHLIGQISLRLGFNDTLYYGGHIGYTVHEAYRNLGVATNACLLLIPVMKAHGFRKVIITNNYINTPSRRVCEKLGCKLTRIAKIPSWHELYLEGQRYLSIYELTL